MAARRAMLGHEPENMTMTMSSCLSVGLVVSLLGAVLSSCGGRQPAAPAAGSSDGAFAALAKEILEDTYRRQPTQATYLGIHRYDDTLEDYSHAAIVAQVQAMRAFRTRLGAIDPTTLSADKQLDREQLLLAMDGRILAGEVVKTWAKDPDTYSSGLTNTAYIMVKRNFAPLDERLKLVIAREKKMPAALAEARKNLDNPPRVFTDIAIEQFDGNLAFFKTAVPEAFAAVKDKALLAEFKKANDGVVAALGAYKKWLQTTLLPRSKGSFALGAATYAQLLHTSEMIDVPLDQLLSIAEANLRTNQAAFVETAKKVDPKKPALAVLAALQADHPPAEKLLAVTQGLLDALRQFIADHHIVTIPPSEAARVQETPPFLRATTSASMDTPGAFEKVATEAYYSMTLPDPKWSAAEKSEFMKQWYYAAISNVSVHEVYPGHYVQFLYAKDFPSDIRKVFGANTNVEGWAHYGEQMMIDEGFHADDPRYRLAQIQDALLRNARFIVGIKMHTQGMTLAQAQDFFVKQGYQPTPVARAEARRGTSDPLYGYYTMGKLMILKLRDDYKAKMGAAYTLQGFHDAFIKLGPLPLPLVRKAMLGDVGTLF
jgi:uncharacterized protein (DUF885 family)